MFNGITDLREHMELTQVHRMYTIFSCRLLMRGVLRELLSYDTIRCMAVPVFLRSGHLKMQQGETRLVQYFPQEVQAIIVEVMIRRMLLSKCLNAQT